MSDATLHPVHHHLSTRQRLLLTAGALACYALWYLLLSGAGVPAEPGISSTLLMGQPAYGIVLVAIVLPVMSVLISLLVGRVRFEAGLFCSLAGLLVLPARGGDIRNALLDAGSPSVYPLLIVEAAVLLGAIVGTYLLLCRLRQTPWLALADPEPQADNDPDTLGDRITVLAAQAVAALLIALIVGQSPVKGQALATACVSGLLATLAIHQTYKVRGSVWYIAGTMLAGIGAWAYQSFQPEGARIGAVTGFAAGAARSLPLHYATLGAAGAILGYWISVTWRGQKKLRDAEAQPA